MKNRVPRSKNHVLAPDLLKLLSTIVLNAKLQPDAGMNGSTDCYAVPLEDIEAARDALNMTFGSYPADMTDRS